MGLDGEEVCEYTGYGGGGGEHDDEPEIELGFGPGVGAFSLDDVRYDGCSGHDGEGVEAPVALGGAPRILDMMILLSSENTS